MKTYDVVAVGAGHAGAQLCITLRQSGFEGSIALIGEEPYPPYERPPLSKEYLSGDRPFERMLIRPVAFWQERGIDLMLGRRVEQVDPAGGEVTLDNGERIGFGDMVWAAGGSPRRLSCAGHDLPGVHAVRTRADVDRLTAELSTINQVVIVGGGYIGLEAASALTKAGKTVILVEALERVLARVAGAVLSRFIAGEHRAHGVDLRTGISVESIEGDARVSGVRLSDGSSVAADAVIVGIGIEPAIAPLVRAGADASNGVEVDPLCRTSLSRIYAVGDCACHANRFADGARIRLESVQNANDQASVAARAILGSAAPYAATPWFWSNQYDIKLQTVGLSGGHDAYVVRGDPAQRSFSVVYLRGGRIIALDCVNAVRDYVAGRRLVEAGARIDAALLADISVPLKQHVEGVAA